MVEIKTINFFQEKTAQKELRFSEPFRTISKQIRLFLTTAHVQ